MRTGVLLIAFLVTFASKSQPIEIRKDVSDQWKVLTKDGTLADYERQAAHTIHLFVTDEFKGGSIAIATPGEVAVFIDGKLHIRTKSKINLKVDSLLSVSGGTPLLSVYQAEDVKSIKMELIRQGYVQAENEMRATTYFSDFIILSSLLLFGFFVLLFRSNTRLTIDYLNLAKVFSVQEREEAIVMGRIGSSVNLFFFVFISLFCGLLLLIVFNHGPLFLRKVKLNSITDAFGWWLLISLFVLMFLVAKLALVWCMSALFGYKGVVRFQFFNFIRSMYVASAIMGVLMLVYFVLELESPDFFYFLLASVCGFMMLTTLFVYLKLMSRTSSTVFHLFSYLCGSEIISLMILIKVLLN